jgi:iron complex transport system substrate-binding protein
VVALQAFATWIHPERFRDLDPEATHRELHARFLPIPYGGIFWATLEQPRG